MWRQKRDSSLPNKRMQQISTKEIQDETSLGGRWSTGNCARDWNLTILPNGISTSQNQSEKEAQKILCDFDTHMDHLILARRPNLLLISKKKKKKKEFPITQILPFQWTTLKMKESEKLHKYLDLAREQKKKNCGIWEWIW